MSKEVAKKTLHLLPIFDALYIISLVTGGLYIHVTNIT